MISKYWVGQIPATPLVIEIRNDDGELVDLSSYTTFTVQILDPYNDILDLNGSLDTSNKDAGRFVWSWPTGGTIFEYPGEYILRLEIAKSGALDYTSQHVLYVSEYGGTI